MFDSAMLTTVNSSEDQPKNRNLKALTKTEKPEASYHWGTKHQFY